jgi:hypothetical protein
VKGRVQEEERKVKIEERMGKGRVKTGERKVNMRKDFGKGKGDRKGVGI